VAPLLATFDDVSIRSDTPLPDGAEARVTALLGDVSARVCKLARQGFAQEQTTDRIRPIGMKLTLPQRPVISVDAVGVIDYLEHVIPVPMPYWDGGDEVWLDRGDIVINLAESIRDLFRFNTPLCQVTYTHGYDEVPNDIVGVTCAMALRALSTPQAGAIQSQTVGPFSVSLSKTAAAGSLALTPDEREIVLSYRRPGRTVELR
jgi:hypothetical protein